MMKWLSFLPQLQELSFPHCVRPPWSLERYELQVFCDASSTGYGSVAYLCMVRQNNCHCSILMGKFRAAPSIKWLAVPRLELATAVAGVRLANMLIDELDIQIAEVVNWTDASCVLQYIANESVRYRVLVHNRLSIIHESTSTKQLQHVPMQLNPADINSRGFLPS